MSFVARNHPQQVGVRGPLDEIDDRTTPDEVFLPLAERFGGFTVDAAAAPHNAKCGRFWTRAEDGLLQDWTGERVWCNPPYSELPAWLRKAHLDADVAELIVMLLPANRTEQGWWQDYVEPYRDGRHPFGPRTEFWRGRTRFIKPGQTDIKPNERPPFGCVLAIWENVDRAGLRSEPAGVSDEAVEAAALSLAQADIEYWDRFVPEAQHMHIQSRKQKARAALEAALPYLREGVES